MQFGDKKYGVEGNKFGVWERSGFDTKLVRLRI